MEGLRKLLLGKLHGLTVTHADIAYEGSISISADLLSAAGLVAGEAVWVWNVTNGNRFETYTITGEAGSSIVSVNGAAARLVSPGDKVIVAAFIHLPESRVESHKPSVVFVDQLNRIKALRPEIPGPALAVACDDGMLRV